eukprot:TRINITY_DN106265_c0_g1_i1.p1 TRINITY_DN106265_c0_g1~~TRINITY_DN106265_c0_g1_i1.p1  ORF type:complete len:169 (+),score=21.76 TRINITY_DN106265_c0_g1_i1:78-584(+)
MPDQVDQVALKEGRRLLWHAAWILFTATFVAGGGFTVAITSGVGAESQFRTAHIGGTVHAALLFGASSSLHLLQLTALEVRRLTDCCALMGWGNTLGYTLGAFLKARGLKPITLMTTAPYLLDFSNSGPLGGLVWNILPNTFFVAAIIGLTGTIYFVDKGTRSANKRS